MKSLINAKILLSDKILEGYTLYFDTKIRHITQEAEPNITEIIDAKGAFVSAGFIDLHIHGSGGADVMDASPEALDIISNALLSTGTTSFLATTMTMSPTAIEKALQNIKRYGNTVTGANILGIHLEGPFLNTSKHGAQDKAFIVGASMALIEEVIEEIKMITIAPEVEGNEDFIKALHQSHPHIILSIGHSDASYTQSLESFKWGISHATHLFNAMNPYHHREPSIVGAVFESDVTCDIIADLIHTHPSALRLTQQIKQEKLILITDAMRAGCMPSGIYELGGQKVEVNQGKATLNDGTLAGSVLKLNEALATMCQHTQMTLLQAVYAVTYAPAGKLGLSKGELKEGYDADIVIFDENFSIISTIVGGEIKYTRR